MSIAPDAYFVEVECLGESRNVDRRVRYSAGNREQEFDLASSPKSLFVMPPSGHFGRSGYSAT